MKKLRPRMTRRKLKRVKNRPETNGARLTRKRRKPSPFQGNSQWGKLMRARGILKLSATQRQRIASKAGKVGGKARWRKASAETPT